MDRELQREKFLKRIKEMRDKSIQQNKETTKTELKYDPEKVKAFLEKFKKAAVKEVKSEEE